MAAQQHPPASSPSLVSASAQGAKFLILLQVTSRLLTFFVNQILLRYLSPALLGVSVQLELFTISILYFSRESFRNALQRQKPTVKGKDGRANDAQTVVNISTLTIPLGVLFSAILGLSYAHSLASNETAQQPYFKLSVGLYVFATMLELLAEPGFAVAQLFMLYKARAAAESAAAFARCLITCGVTVWASQQGMVLGPLPFAAGQVAYGVVLLGVYVVKIMGIAKKEGFSVVFRKMTGKDYYAGYFQTSLCSLALTMWIQSSIKHILTQGDSILVAWLTTIHDQGIYALAANYGSLIARMLFQPLEESSRNLFAKLLSSDSGLPAASKILRSMIKLYLLLSLFAAALGPPFAPLGLSIIAGKRWAGSDAAAVLAAYCYYIPLLAINGITEAFVQSVATPAQLHRQSAWMFSFSLGFATAGYFFVRTLGWGAQGLVAANCVNMLLRIVWSSVFIRGYFAGKKIPGGLKWEEVLPATALTPVAVVVAGVARRVEPRNALEGVGYAGALGGLLVVSCAVAEKRFFMELWRTVREGK